jgi:hypothetical protein
VLVAGQARAGELGHLLRVHGRDDQQGLGVAGAGRQRRGRLVREPEERVGHGAPHEGVLRVSLE